jgi:ribosome maturation factor RimP
MAKVTDQMEEIVKPVIEELGFKLFDIEFVKEGKSWFLRIYVDRPGGGITIEDCVLVSEHISETVDQLETDPIPQAYYLEVSSPGAERPLKDAADVQAAIGEWVFLSFYQAVDGQKNIQGRLKAVEADEYVIETKDKTRLKEVSVSKTNVSLIRLAIEF